MAACTSSAPIIATQPAPATAGMPAPVSPPPAAATDSIDRPHARWIAATWTDLPGWPRDRSADALPAFLR
ncbi:MAG: hypothetical protein M3Y55_00690, partial [Pseudomonadota bacterium]|nr:hypothetical protein [Pseudomonadota bacterium]